MNAVSHKTELTAHSDAELRAIGRFIGERLFPGAFIAFFGGLGAGKTTMTKGIAAALGIEGILSPTFTIVRRHRGKLTLDHFDAYRIEEADELYAIGYEDHLASDSVKVMEWCENVPEALPAERLEIHIAGSGSELRRVELLPFGKRYEEITEALL
ncbi:MAG: tRNA (adenosine(37)-N6)-threonylcarbamoyltransferase complex ATPase subunit type 1 TsaE [Clostridia bacterium]|nr:tRNA (adenosine(37)-N6)-threonylcarbamoyltransferase complex ATPase subunit type 1 TsaE [Clostridia bacterium]